MSQILILLGGIIGVANSNIGCTMNLANQLVSDGHKVSIISYESKNQVKTDYSYRDIDYIYIKRPKYLGWIDETSKKNRHNTLFRLLRLARLIYLMARLYKFPDTDPIPSRRFYKAAKRRMRDSDFDMVIGVFRPYDTISALLKIKKLHKNVICVGYYLDILEGATHSPLINDRTYTHLCRKADKKTFSKLDHIIMAESGKSIYNNDEYFSSVVNKIHYAGFPLIMDMSSISEFLVNTDKPSHNIVFCFAGSMNSQYRNPSYFLKLFSLLHDEYCSNFTLHIFGNIDNPSLIEPFTSMKPNNIFYHGAVTPYYALQSLKSADMVINLSNSLDNIVPSKIYELFSFCKPMISFISNPNDPSLQELSRYPLSHIIFENVQQIRGELERLIEFIKDNLGKSTSFDEVYSTYFKNTPRYLSTILYGLLREGGSIA